jgi:hypothetical protein
MSSQTIVLNTGQQAIINTDLSRLFVGENRYEKGSYLNGTYDPVTLAVGTLLGRVALTGLLKPLASAAVDGSQYPVGVVAESVTVDEGDQHDNIYFCVAGDVIASKIVLDGADTLDTVIDGRRIRDRIGADTVGIKLITQNNEMSGPDNS